LYGIEKLRALILDLAVRGKLAQQDPNDEPADQLLKQIASDVKSKAKANVLQNSQTKSQTALKQTQALPLPRGWVLTCLGNVVLGHLGGGTPSKSNPKYWNGEIRWASVKDVGKTKFLLETEDSITQQGLENSSSNLIPANNLLVVTRMGLGQLSINKIEVAINQDIRALIPSSHMDIDYIYNYFLTCKIDGAGLTVKGIRLEKLLEMAFPLPPLAEQHRIVAKVDELMGLCDRLEAGAYDAIAAHQLLVTNLLATLTNSKNAADFAHSWKRIETHFDTLFTTEESINHLIQTILQLAVMGKLVPQDAKDEPASELLKQVRQTRIKIASQQKMRKLMQHNSEKNSAKPFDLPSGWQWATFPELGIFDRGKSKHRPRNDPKLFTPGIHPLVQTGEVARADEYIREFHSEYSDVGLAQSRMWPKGTLCITIAANIADTAILDFDACFPDSVVGFIPFEPIISPRYFLHFMKTAKADLLKYAPSTAQKNINIGILDSVQIPIPPIEEMTRIVQKVDSLISICGKLKARLNQAQHQQIQFADAIASRVAA
jgi:type I restriction enzyme, S subunit